MRIALPAVVAMVVGVAPAAFAQARGGAPLQVETTMEKALRITATVVDEPNLERVRVDVSSAEISVPGLVAVRVIVEGRGGRPVPPARIPRSWQVLVTSGGAVVATALVPSSVGPWLDGEVAIRRPGWHRLGALVRRVDAPDVVSSEVPVAAVAAVDLGVVRAGQTVCRPLPGGGRGLRGRVVTGHLPQGLRLWGGCLVGEEGLVASRGTFRAEVDVQSGAGLGHGVDQRLYDISYRTEPRSITAKRVLYGLSSTAVVIMLAVVAIAVRSGGKGA